MTPMGTSSGAEAVSSVQFVAGAHRAALRAISRCGHRCGPPACAHQVRNFVEVCSRSGERVRRREARGIRIEDLIVREGKVRLSGRGK